jgi:tyrosyl-tRNA synthetase
VKLGLDPTRPDIHLGHTVVLRALARFQKRGHIAVLIIGDTTAQIGDPSGQSVTRPQLTREEVEAAASTYMEQAWKILDRDSTEVRRQSEWFGAMGLGDVVRLMATSTVAKMLARDDFARRFREGRPIGLHELLYPLLQGYDSVAVHSDLELGGTDQTFNLLVGRDMQEAFGQPPQDIMTLPLLEGLDGVQKMSKSLDNYVGVDEPAEVMFWKLMAIPDALIGRYLTLAAGAEPDEVRAEEEALRSAENPKSVKARLARRIVTQFHGPQEATRAEAAFGEQQREVRQVKKGRRALAELFLEVGLVSSKGEARRLAAQHGLTLNGQMVGDVDEVVNPQNGWVLGRGKRSFVELRVG